MRQGYSDGSHSEIEVSNYSEWGPDAILKRGIDLLKFLESRWNLKFEDEEAMAELLFLNFFYELDEDDKQ